MQLVHFYHIVLLQDLKETLAKELDFVNEGHNGERCAKELSNLPYVYVPKIIWDLTSKVFNFTRLNSKFFIFLFMYYLTESFDYRVHQRYQNKRRRGIKKGELFPSGN